MKRTICTTMKMLLAALGAGAARAAEVGYYAQPALHEDRLVFVSEGDLWTARLGGDGGIIAVTRSGEIAMRYNSQGMKRASASSSTDPIVRTFKD